MIEKPQLVIFDCDGVLVDSEVIFHQVLSEDLTQRGMSITTHQSMNLFMGGSMVDVAQVVKSRGIDIGDDWIESIYSGVMDRLEQGVDVVEGIPELLAYLTKIGIPFCVASNGPASKMQVTLGQNDLLPYFEGAIFSAYDVEIWKPDPGLFLHAANHFSVAPQHCVVIEDSVTGTLGAKNAQMACLAYAPHGPNEKLQENGAKLFSSMNDVVGLLGL